MLKLSLGKIIKKFRELRRITQKALGDRTHLDGVRIRPVILNDEEPEYTNTDIYFGSEAILRIRNMLDQWQEMKEKYENNEITKEALQDWKANYPDSLKKDYVPFEESNVKFYRKGITAKIPPDIK